jgi:hypothetical protein
VLKNIIKHYRANFLKDVILGALERFKEFMADWPALIYSLTEENYGERLILFRKKYPVESVTYCEETWLMSYKELLISCWIDNFIYFGHRDLPGKRSILVPQSHDQNLNGGLIHYLPTDQRILGKTA